MEQKRTIQFASQQNLSQLESIDWLSDTAKLKEKIERHELLVCEEEGQITSLLRFSWFWDNIPFINLIWVMEELRGRGRASQLIEHLAKVTEGRNQRMILASTQSNENAQYFFRKIGFVDAGEIAIKDQPLELILIRYLNEENEATEETSDR